MRRVFVISLPNSHHFHYLSSHQREGLCAYRGWSQRTSYSRSHGLRCRPSYGGGFTAHALWRNFENFAFATVTPNDVADHWFFPTGVHFTSSSPISDAAGYKGEPVSPVLGGCLPRKSAIRWSSTLAFPNALRRQFNHQGLLV